MDRAIFPSLLALLASASNGMNIVNSNGGEITGRTIQEPYYVFAHIIRAHGRGKHKIPTAERLQRPVKSFGGFGWKWNHHGFRLSYNENCTAFPGSDTTTNSGQRQSGSVRGRSSSSMFQKITFAERLRKLHECTERLYRFLTPLCVYQVENVDDRLKTIDECSWHRV